MAGTSPSNDGERPSFRFPRAFRLKRKRLIRPLFDRSRGDVETVVAGCVRVLYRVVDRQETGVEVPVQVGFAPGRTPDAVTRNRLRRIMREVYRERQHVLVDLFVRRDQALTMMILFRGRHEQARRCLPHDLPRALDRVAARLGGRQ